jgi:mannose/fructose/N-acetylgalactosamine-specific phosphotransferase system component IID
LSPAELGENGTALCWQKPAQQGKVMTVLLRSVLWALLDVIMVCYAHFSGYFTGSETKKSKQMR